MRSKPSKGSLKNADTLKIQNVLIIQQMKPVGAKFPIGARGLTLLEMTLVMLLLMALMGTALVSNRKYTEWKLGREAAEILRTVHSAQRLYLSDNPTVAVSTITPALLLPYMPNNATAMPTVKSLAGTNLSILVNVSPPIINNGSGRYYDPSSSRTDNLWDVGE
jgi:type II secretory pathway pseudopilin PulG